MGKHTVCSWAVVMCGTHPISARFIGLVAGLSLIHMRSTEVAMYFAAKAVHALFRAEAGRRGWYVP